ncbi:hypothetical protein OGATHE_001974 [Ogataea polymorpha]|uniref:Uncharacterized protein n=1 Tax=Ogataea polymorpha TaxID=460523 RepID=A0A9P8PML3_9ASCO|nr:hypothetical protein OGATHE_001974 [Ogataea polymorpha]
MNASIDCLSLLFNEIKSRVEVAFLDDFHVVLGHRGLVQIVVFNLKAVRIVHCGHVFKKGFDYRLVVEVVLVKVAHGDYA